MYGSSGEGREMFGSVTHYRTIWSERVCHTPTSLDKSGRSHKVSRRTHARLGRLSNGPAAGRYPGQIWRWSGVVGTAYVAEFGWLGRFVGSGRSVELNGKFK